MAKFLTTQEISAGLLRIIRDAKEHVVLISPYLQVNDLIKEQIKYKVETSKVEVWLIYREDKLRPEDRDWLDSMPSIKRGLLKNLHAKCYMNEKEAILTSMNLYEYSQNNNNEMGILISYQLLGNDNDVYKDIYKEVQRLVTISSQALAVPAERFCIRCGVVLPANSTQPYCNHHFKIWNRYKNEEYEEKYCHICGDEHTATFKKPACLACYRKYKDVLEFAAS